METADPQERTDEAAGPPRRCPRSRTAFEEIEVELPLVGIIMGSANDKQKMQAAGAALHEAGIRYEVRVMSAHRDPDKVRDYCRNARMRGLKVIIAGAGMSAALPGVAAAHTDLPVIGVPISGKTLGGLDALLSAVQMPPGVPVACVASTAPRTPACSPRASSTRENHSRDLLRFASARRGATGDPSVHARRDRGRSGPSSGGWGLARGRARRHRGARRRGRRPGRGGAGLPRAGRVHGRGGRGARARRRTTTSPPSSTSSPASIGEQGRWIHYGLTSSDVLDTALALQLVEAGPILLDGAHAYRDALIEQALRAPRHARRRPHPRGPRRADELRPAARRVRLRGRPQPRAAASRVRAASAVGKLSGAVGTYASLPPAVEERGDGGARPRARGRLDPGRPPRPPRRGAEAVRARRRRAGAVRDRDPQPAADRGARGRGAVRRRPEGLLGDAAQAQPDHSRSGSAASPGCCAATRRPGSRTWRSGTSATSPTPARSG